MRCRACAAPGLVHDDVAALVCAVCGTIADPARPVLADTDADARPAPPPAARNARGWSLAQTKQDRDRRNATAMRTFIAAVLANLNSPGLSPRAEAIFTQAMATGGYRWGRRAKRTAGASIAVALREAHKPDSLRDIAFFLDESAVSLARAFRSVVALLDLSLAPTDPAVHLPTLHAFLRSIVPPETSSLPTSLASVLSRLSLQAAVRTATSLSQIISLHSPPLPVASLPTPPTACALLILGLEAESRAPLPHLAELARTLGSRFALAPATVSSRYKTLYDLVEDWVRHVPWLDHFAPKGTGRAKLSKRTVVARGIKDVVQFHHEIGQSRTQSQQKVDLDLEPDPDDPSSQEDDEISDSVPASSSQPAGTSAMSSPPGKRRRVEKKQVTYPPPPPSLDPATSNGDLSLLTHLLTCSPDELASARGTPPTRLQLLVASRGGSTPDKIPDEELFADGELQGLLRDEHEREALRPLFQLNWGQEAPTEDPAACHRERIASRGAERINMDALARLLRGSGDGEEDTSGPPEADNEASEDQPAAEAAELVHDWNASPDDDSDIFGEFDNNMTADDRYEEEL